MTASKTMDRRQRKSRAALQQALLTLIATKAFEAVTIDDVTAEADVARATFYAHYKDKLALLLEAGTALIDELAEMVGDEADMEGGIYDGVAVSKIFEHAAEHQPLYLLIISGEGGSPVRARVFEAFEKAALRVFGRMAAQDGRTPRTPLPLAATAYVGAMLRTVEHWLEAGTPTSPQEITAEFLRAQAGGLEWVLGFEPGETEFVPPG
jgi:AcrR family transcriptional regulator